MNIFKKLFKKKEKEEVITAAEDIKEVVGSKDWDSRECIMCHREIGIDKKRWANGKLFHKKCFKQAVSMVINGKSQMISKQ